MDIRDQINDGVAVVTLTGRLTINDRPGLVKETIVAAMRQGARAVCLDLSGVIYLDSTRLGELIAAHVTIARQGGRLKLVATPPRIMELLSMAGLVGIFELHDSLATARASVES